MDRTAHLIGSVFGHCRSGQPEAAIMSARGFIVLHARQALRPWTRTHRLVPPLPALLPRADAEERIFTPR
jgi:hypothetical protein